MDVAGVRAGPTGTEFSSALRRLAGPDGQLLAALEGVPQSGDTIATSLRELSELAVLRFLEIIERPLSPENEARLVVLHGAAVSAAAEGNVREALVKLAEFAELDPRRAETLELEPELASLRPEVRQLLSRLGSAANLDAESRLGQARHLFETAIPNQPLEGFRPEIAILIAGRLQEAGGYANCVNSAMLSQMAISHYVFPSSPAPRSAVDAPASLELGRRWMAWIKQLWRRAPLLVLLLGWLAVGFVGGSVSAILRVYWKQMWLESLVAGAFEVWAVGFLALVGFGFYTQVRNWRNPAA